MPGRQCGSLAEAVALIAGEPLLFRPGTEYRYSIYGWILISAVIAGAAGEPFPTFMTREVFEPLGMESTVLEDADEVPPGTTSFYGPRTAMRTNLGIEEASAAHYSCLAGAGAFLSTPSDLVRFGSAILKPGLLKAAPLRSSRCRSSSSRERCPNTRWAGRFRACSLPRAHTDAGSPR